MGLIFRRAVFDQDGLALDEAYFLQALAKGGHEVRSVSERGVPQETNHRHRRLLRARRERPRGCRAAECGQEFSSSYVACHVTLRRGSFMQWRDDTTLPSRGLCLAYGGAPSTTDHLFARESVGGCTLAPRALTRALRATHGARWATNRRR